MQRIGDLESRAQAGISHSLEDAIDHRGNQGVYHPRSIVTRSGSPQLAVQVRRHMEQTANRLDHCEDAAQGPR